LLYPVERATSQTASEKDYPVDFSHFNINGRCYGSFGTDPKKTAYPNVNLKIELGNGKDKIKLKAPYVFPAMAKLNWRGYYTGAALSGVIAVIGEAMPTKDPDTVIKNERVTHLPLLKEMFDSFYHYNEGCGALFLQANVDDERLGLLDYALEEIKALQFQQMGYEVYPDPSDPTIQEASKKHIGPPFYKVGRLPEWKEESFIISIKTGPFRPADLARTVILASKAGVDMITVDGAGGGTGNSPIHMMNEWGYPTVYLETVLFNICQKMQEKKFQLPAIVMTGGFAFEDHIFKGLALGAPHIKLIGLGRAAMAAAMVGETLGKMIQKGSIPADLSRFGQSISDIFCGIPELRARFGDEVANIPTGAIGVYNYVERINTGLQQLMALCRKYQLDCISRDDIIPLTRESAEITGLTYVNELDLKEIDKIIKG